MAVLRRGSASVLAVTLALSVVAILGILPGCSDDDATCPTAAGTIKGTILTAGDPVGVHLRAWYLPDSGQQVSHIQDASTDSTGAYSLEVPPGNYRLQVAGFRCGRYYAQGTLVEESANAETLVVQAGKTITADVNSGALRIELDTPELSGTAFVRLADVESRCSLVSNPVQLQGGHATFEIPQVGPGTYRMLLELTDGSRVWLPGVLESADADTITIATGQRRTYEASLPRPAVLHGTVTGSWQELGLPPPELYLYDPNASHIYVSTRVSSTDGSYTIQLCAWVHTLMKITIAGTQSWYGGATVYQALSIDIAPGQTREVNIRESGIAGWLNRQPSTYGGPVTVWNADSTARGECYPSGTDGFFRISNLEPGTYYLKHPGRTGLDRPVVRPSRLTRGCHVGRDHRGRAGRLARPRSRGWRQDRGAPAARGRNSGIRRAHLAPACRSENMIQTVFIER